MATSQAHALDTLVLEALSSGMTRRDFMRRALALGISISACAAALQALEGARSAHAAPGAPVPGSSGGQATVLPGIHVVPRTAWGSPDKERSPQWVPFYQQPFHIVVHHTAEVPGPHGPVADVQATWRYQALDEGWGDLGYNYILDTAGTIYEGRAGGPDTVGAHTHGFNQGSIGIAMIGNYDTEQPAAPMLRSLQTLLVALANRYGIDVLGTASDNGVIFDTIAGHRDFNATDCPGTHLYALLPALRTALAEQVHTAAQPVGPATIYLHSGTPYTVLVQLRNTGTTTWNGRYALQLSAAPFLGLPASYNLPETPPGGLAQVPLFLPALANNLTLPLQWALLDASAAHVGVAFTLTLQTLLPGAAMPSSPPAVLDAVAAATASSTAGTGSAGSAGPAALPVAGTPATGAGSPLPGAAATWYFAAGSSNKFDDESIALLNPGARPAYVVATLVRAGADPVSLAALVPPAGQTMLGVSFAAGRGSVLGVIVRSTEPLAAERILYHASPTTEGTGGTTVPGHGAPAPVWYLPHLAVAADETGTVDVLNPTASPTTIAVDVVSGTLLRAFKQVTLPPLSTVRIALPVPVASAVVRVLSPATAGVIADALTLYDQSQGATVVAGVPALSVDGYLPGFSGGPHTYVMVLNPGPQTSQLLLSGLGGSGQTIAQTRLTLPPGTQAQVDLAQGAMSQSQVVHVQATQPVACAYTGLLGPSAETSLAADYRGSASTGLAQPARTISFAAGDTRHPASDPHEWLLLFNPQTTALTVSIASFAAAGNGSRRATVGAGATALVSLDDLDPGGTHSLLVQCDQEIVAWHGIDSNESAIRLLSPGIGG